MNVPREDQGVLGDADLHRHQLKGGSIVYLLMSRAHEVKPLLPLGIASREMGQIIIGGAKQGAGVLWRMQRDKSPGIGVLRKKMATGLVLAPGRIGVQLMRTMVLQGTVIVRVKFWWCLMHFGGFSKTLLFKF